MNCIAKLALLGSLIWTGGASAQAVVVRDAGDNFLGYYAGYAGNRAGPGGVPYPAVKVVSNKGYVFGVRETDGTVLRAFVGATDLYTELYFTDEACASEPYIAGPVAFVGGFVVNTFPPEAALFYTPKGALSSTRLLQSKRDTVGGQCQSGGPPGDAVSLPLLVNDPTETGVTHPQIGPITLGVIDAAGDLFADGFELQPG